MAWSGNEILFMHKRNLLRMGFVVVAIAITVLTLLVSDRLIGRMADEERSKMELWARATGVISSSDDDPLQSIELMLGIIESNKSIPLILCNDKDSILISKNITLPIGGKEKDFLQKKLAKFKDGYKPIVINLDDGSKQYLYYNDSATLRRLLMMPYVLLFVMFAFVAVAIIALVAERRAEQNRVWSGLSKETAHQLGTPISSLMAWMEILQASGTDEGMIAEMRKDVNRLTTIAERFQKVGSEPTTTPTDLYELINSSCSYMRLRISKRVELHIEQPEEPIFVRLSDALFSWVIENLIKNAVDAMKGEGEINICFQTRNKMALIDVSDTGCGIAKAQQREIFRPGFTTKKRGWGLGLSLVKRIVEEYHQGKIWVKSAELNVGTTIRIQLPIVEPEELDRMESNLLAD